MKCDRCKKDKKRVYRGICQTCYQDDRIARLQTQAPLIPCACGCGELIPSIGKNGRPQTFKNGHSSKGELNSNWNGGRTIDDYGYVKILSPDHPFKDSRGYVKEHRLVMEKHLGRYLKQNELVHHRDENKQNNKIENLELITRSAHQGLHNPNKGKRKDMTGIICIECGSDITYPSKNGQPHWCLHPISGKPYVCEKCYKRISAQTRTEVLYRRKKDISKRVCMLCGARKSESSSGQSTWRSYKDGHVCKSCFDTKVRVPNKKKKKQIKVLSGTGVI